MNVILTSSFILTARPEDRPMYVVAFALRIAAGYAGGLTAQRLALEPGAELRQAARR